MKWSISRRRPHIADVTRMNVMRAFAFPLIVFLIVGCESATPDLDVRPLHTDADVEALVDHDIVSSGDQAYLDAVPLGNSRVRRDVFRELNLNEGKLSNFRWSGRNMGSTLAWQVSPSYDIVCLSALNEPSNEGLEMDAHNRLIYGIRLVPTGRPLW